MKFEREFTDEEIKILSHDLLDINVWINGMIDGKINNCQKRAANEYRSLLKQEGAESMPTSDSVAVTALFSRKDYQNRTTREQAKVTE